MAIRLKDADSSLGRLVPVLAGVGANLEGLHSVAPIRLGAIAGRLQNVVPHLSGVYAPSSAYLGSIDTLLSLATANISGTFRNNSVPITDAPRDFTPGHYMDADSIETLTGVNLTQTRVNEIANTPFKGVRHRYYWKTLEPTKGVYDFSKIHQHIAWCAAIGKKLTIQVQDRIFNGQTSSRFANCFPDWLKFDAEFEGGIHQRYSDETRGWAPRLWVRSVIDRKIALLQALISEFDNNPTVVLFQLEETTCFDGSIRSVAEAAGYTETKRVNEQKRIADAVAAATIYTPVQIQTNFFDWIGGRLPEIIDYFRAKKIMVGGPDIITSSADGNTTAQRIINGLVDGIDRRPGTVHQNCVEWNTAGRSTLEEIQHAVMIKHQQHMISWVYRQNQTGLNWPEIKAWVVANNPPTHTDWRY